MTGADLLAFLLRDTIEREQLAASLAFCVGCRHQYDSRNPCGRCAAFKRGKPWRHDEVIR